MDIKDLKEAIAQALNEYYDESITLHGTVDGYDCKVTIFLDDNGLFGYEETMTGTCNVGFAKTPQKAWEDFQVYINQFLGFDEEHEFDNDYLAEFEFDDDIDEQLEKFNYQCFKKKQEEDEE